MASDVKVSAIPSLNMIGWTGVICNGEIEMSASLRERVFQCSTLIGVDGGLNHCKKMDVFPHFIVGDFDSVDPSILGEFKEKGESTVLPRAKDCTDLEAALEKARSISAYAQIIIWGGLGGRFDHTLGNIYTLLRYPMQLFLESEEQLVFAINDVNGGVEIEKCCFKTMALFPLNGAARNISIKKQNETVCIPLIDKSTPFIFPFQETCCISIETGELLVILDIRNIVPLKDLPLSDISLDISLKQPLIHIFSYLTHQSSYFQSTKLCSDKETIFSIQPASFEVSIPSQRGLTLSLIPFYGPATGIKTKGLKWELGEGTLDRLDKEFIGISNVSMGEAFSVSLTGGELLCVINQGLIDEELVQAELK